MRVLVYTNKIQIMTTLVSMIAAQGCAFTQMIKFDETLIKGHDMMIIDLDNVKDCDNLKNFLGGYPEILIVGTSMSGTLLDEYRGIIKVEKKPFLQQHVLYYKEQVEKLIDSKITINKDIQRIYDELGRKMFQTFDNLSISDQIQLFKKKIESSPATIESESDFLAKSRLDLVKLPTSIDKIERQPDLTAIFEDKALLKYRIRKLQKMNISAHDINLKIEELNKNKFATKSDAITTSQHRKDILKSLMAGVFTSDPTPIAEIKQAAKPPIQSSPELVVKKPSIGLPIPTIKTPERVAPISEIFMPKIPSIQLPARIPKGGVEMSSSEPVESSVSSPTFLIPEIPNLQLPAGIPIKSEFAIGAKPLATTIPPNKNDHEVVKEDRDEPRSMLDRMKERISRTQQTNRPPEIDLGRIADNKSKPPR